MINYNSLLENVFQKVSKIQEGHHASYIPELCHVDPHLFAIAITTVDGETHSVGDADYLFTMQSTSKPFTYGMALNDFGLNSVHSKVGVEPTGEAFNSIIELEKNTHRPFNPMINSGAIAISSLIKDKDGYDRFNRLLNHFSSLSGRPLNFNQDVFLSEKKTAHRNRAIAHLLRHFEVIGDDIEESLDLYFKQCSIEVNIKDLSIMAATLSNQGIHPISKKTIYCKEFATKITGLIFTCGMYDTAGTWAHTVGIPAKSGVSGAIFGVIPNKFGIACFSPLINDHGHSVKAMQAIAEITKILNVNIFN